MDTLPRQPQTPTLAVPSSEATTRERRGFIFFLGAISLALLARDLRSSWPAPALVASGQIALSTALLTVALALRETTDPAAARRVVRLLALVTAVAFGAVVWGTGGTAGPYVPLYAALPIIFNLAVPDDVEAALILSLVAGTIGVASVAGEALAPQRIAFWCVAHVSSSGYAVASTFLHSRLRLREQRVRDDLVCKERERTRHEVERGLLTTRLEILGQEVNDILLLVCVEGGRIHQANDRALQAYGYGKREILQLSIRDLRADGAPEDVGDLMRRAVAEHGLRFCTVHRRRDGTTFPVEVSTRPLHIGGALMLQSVIRDISKERAASAAAEYQAMLLENLHDAVIGLDATFRINAWNGAAERLFGIDRKEALGRHPNEILASRYADGISMEELFARAAREGRVQLEVERQNRAREWLSLESTTVAVRGTGGAVLGYVSVNRDISARKRAVAALRASQERLQRILDTLNNGIWIIDAEGRTEYANARAAELFGFRTDDIVGRPFLDALPESLRAEASADLDAIARGESLQRELKLTRPDGADAWLVLSRSPLRDADGRVTGAVAVFVDISVLRNAQEELQQSRRLEAVGRLAAGVAHEINTPIQYIGDNTHFLGEAFTALAVIHQRYREALAAHCPAEVRSEVEQAARDLDVTYLAEETPKTIARTLEGVRRVSTIVRAMKEFAHPDQSERASVDLNRSLQATLEVARNEYKYVADVETDFGEIPALYCIGGDLNQVFLNVIVNAAHAIESALSATYQRGMIRVTTRLKGPEIVVAIADTGVGIPEENRDKVFDPFFTTKPIGRGTGQGLACARAIVKKHGGHVSFTSTVGKGTTFFIRLPVENIDLASPGETVAHAGKSA